MARIPAYLNLPRTAYELRQTNESGVSRVILDGIIDGAPELQHEQSVDVTQFPVGKDTYISDHAIVRPFNLRGRLIVNNSVSLDGKVRTIQSLENAWTSIRSVFISRQTFDVITSFASYQDMIFTNLSREESPDTGTALVINFSMQQVQRVEIDTTGGGTGGSTGRGTGGSTGRGTGGSTGRGTGGTGDEPQGDGTANSGTLNRGRQPLTDVVTADRERDIRLSGFISVANVVNQRFQTTLPSRPILNATISINYNATNSLWTIDVANAGGAQVLANARLINNAFILLKLGNESYGQIQVISQVTGDPGPPTGNSPWGNQHSLIWSID